MAPTAAARGRRAGSVVPAIGESRDCGRPRMAAARRRGNAHRRRTRAPGSIHRNRARGRGTRAKALRRGRGSAPRRSSRSFPTIRPWSGCAAACARTMPRSCASTRSPAASTATRPTVRARATTSGRRCWRRRSSNDGASRPRTSSRRPAQSRASFGGPVMARASRRIGPTASLDATVWINRGNLDRTGRARCRHVGDWRPSSVGRRGRALLG